MTFANLFCLRKKYGTEICIDGRILYIRQKNRIYNGQTAYFAPIIPECTAPEDFTDAVDMILEASRKERIKPYFFGVTEDNLSLFEQSIKHSFKITEQRDWFEYLYRSEKFVDFASSELSKQRRAVNRFWNLYGAEAAVERISPSNIQKVIKYQSDWLANNLDRNMDRDSLISENESILNGLDNFWSLNLEGIIVSVGKSVRGYAYGTILPGGAFDIIAQKGDVEYQQIYKVVLQEHVKTFYERAELTNMEEDIGLVGLRRSKERYKPDYMLKKYTVEFE